MREIVVSAAVSLLLSGCVIVWGGAYEIDEETSDGVTIKYDSNFTSLKQMQQVAQTSCSTHNRRAVLKDQSMSIWHLTTVDFECAPV